MCQEVSAWLLEVFILEGDIVDACEEFPFDFIEGTIAAFKYDFSHFDGFIDTVVGVSTSSTPGKGGDEVSLESRPEDIGADPYHSSGIKHCIDSTFWMVTHN